MEARDSTGLVSEALVGAKHAFFERLDAKRAAAGYAVSPPLAEPPAPPPPPALSFEVWAELSARFEGAPPEELAGALSARGLTLAVWRRFDGEYSDALSDDLRAGQLERQALYEAKHKEEQARRAGTPAAALTGPAALPTQLVPAALRGTADAPDFKAAVWKVVGKMPFVPPAPAAVGQGKRATKTMESRVVQSRVGGQTMPLDGGVLQRRPTASLPFAGSTGGAGVVYVPHLDARQYVSLCAELALRAAPREETLSRYQVPNEAAFRVLEEQWRHPGRRVELEQALADFAVMLRGQMLR
jgi:hypothetical protein